jgi:DNA ligase-1
MFLFLLLGENTNKCFCVPVVKLLAIKDHESLRTLKISLYKPIRPMLAERVRSAEEAMERMKQEHAAAECKLEGRRKNSNP